MDKKQKSKEQKIKYCQQWANICWAKDEGQWTMYLPVMDEALLDGGQNIAGQRASCP
jgi:hypothetical protein